MSDEATQWEIHHETRNHLDLIEPLLERIGSGSAAQVSAGYVEMDSETDERFTDAGWSTCTALRVVALGSAKYLWDVSGRTTGQVDARLLNDTQGFLAVLACALSGMDKDAAASVNPPWVATCLLRMLGELQERIGPEPDRYHPSHEKDVEGPKGNGTDAHTASPPKEPQEPTKTESEQLMPMEAFEAMADALRPLAHGVRSLHAGADDLSACYIDQTSEPWELTRQGAYLLTDLAEDAKKGLERLDHKDGGMLHRYLPDWCKTQLSDIREIVDRAAWMLWGGSEAANQGRDVCSDPPGTPYFVAYPVSSMVKPAYRELCAKFDEYEAAERAAIDQQYEDMGYIRQPNGEWHPTKEMLKEMEASS